MMARLPGGCYFEQGRFPRQHKSATLFLCSCHCDTNMVEVDFTRTGHVVFMSVSELLPLKQMICRADGCE